ncbi:hypothetical protein GCM10011362_32540 [Marinobacter halophilus]|nr:hypothetical protein GCM10011362_32540 [Marinobacter halophilus]
MPWLHEAGSSALVLADMGRLMDLAVGCGWLVCGVLACTPGLLVSGAVSLPPPPQAVRSAALKPVITNLVKWFIGLPYCELL